jgi:hypothetical protein
MEGIDWAYYLVHSMGGRSMFQYKAYLGKDLLAAGHFIKAAQTAGVKSIIYLGGLGEMADNLSEHLKSRQQIAHILQSGKVQDYCPSSCQQHRSRRCSIRDAAPSG